MLVLRIVAGDTFAGWGSKDQGLAGEQPHMPEVTVGECAHSPEVPAGGDTPEVRVPAEEQQHIPGVASARDEAQRRARVYQGVPVVG